MKKYKRIKAATLQSVMEKECHMFQLHMDMPLAEHRDPSKILDAFQNLFETTKKVIYECYLSKCEQASIKTIDQYIAKLLIMVSMTF